MPIIAWDVKYATGNATVDKQHQELFAMVNTLHDGVIAGKGKDVLGPTLDKLAAYGVEHFKVEEGFTKGYPNLARHQAKHVDLTKQAVDIIGGYKSGKSVLPIALSKFLGDWLKQHIMEEDIVLVNWLKGK